MAPIQPYTINITDSEIERLRQKLSLASFPDELDEAGWDYGAPLADVKRLVMYWKNQYDWRRAERTINDLPNYMAPVHVEGFGMLEMHFIYAKSSNKAAIPLLFVHGWPGSFLEVMKLLPLLQESKNGGPAFHVVAPSLPNSGFSFKVTRRGFGLGHYAEACHKLMLELDYKQYVTQGGDWGSTITRIMGQRYPASVKASHLNLVPSIPPSPTSPLPFGWFLVRHILGMYTPAEKEGLERSKEFQKSGMGYYQQQTSKPQTIGYSFADSPVGLLAWIYEKLHDWTDDYPWTDDEICTWVSLHWFSRAGPAAGIRIYYESMRGEYIAKAGGYVPQVKLGLAYFPKEIFRLPKAWGSSLGEVVYEHENQSGGHFAAWEKPESIAEDLRIMFGKGGGAYGVVQGRDGYQEYS